MLNKSRRGSLVVGASVSLLLASFVGPLTASTVSAATLGEINLYSAPGASAAITGVSNFLDTVAVVDDTAWASAGFNSGNGLVGLLAANVARDDSAVQVPIVVAGQSAYICAVEAGPTGGIHEGKIFASYITGTPNGCTNYETLNPDPKGILRIDNVTGQVDDSWSIDGLSFNALSGLAFQGDDTLWLGSYGESIVYRMDLTGSRTSPTMTAIPVGACGSNSPISQLVHLDDTVYVLNPVCSTLIGVNVVTDDTTILAGPDPFQRYAGLTTSPTGDVWFGSHFTVGNPYTSTVRVYRPSDDTEVASAAVDGQIYGIAIPEGSTSVFVSAGNAPTPGNRVYELGLMFGASSSVTLDDTLSTGDVTPYSLVPGLDNRGFVISASLGPNIARIATPVIPATPLLNSATGTPGGIEIAWTEFADGGSPITEVAYAIDGFTRWNLGSLTSPATITTDDAGNPLVPGRSYTVRIQLKNAVGYTSWSNSLTATPTDPTPPTPPPTYPPGQPTDVVAVASDGRATVSWTPPVNEGSFAITDYRVVASPGGATCLAKAPETTCIVERLTNGDTYTFTVQALNGAGWGASSESSNAVTPDGPKPTPTMMVTGSRGTGAKADRVFADGVTTHLVGRQVQARVHLSGQVNYENGSMRTVASDGTFTWQRRTKKTVYVYFRVTDEPGVRSNRLIIRLNRP